MKNSVNYSGFLDIVYSSSSEATSKAIKQAPVQTETQTESSNGETSHLQRSMDGVENINST